MLSRSKGNGAQYLDGVLGQLPQKEPVFFSGIENYSNANDIEVHQSSVISNQSKTYNL